MLAVVPLAGAQAATPQISGAAGYRDCTNVALSGCAVRGTVASGSAVRMHCWIDDSTVTERYSSNRWFYVTGPGAVRGFVHSSRVVNQVVVGNCKDHRGVAPSRWAAMHVGKTVPTSAEKLGTSADRWSGWCYLFAQDAHIFGYNNTPYSGYGTAKNTYYAYKNAGRVSANMDPAVMPIGAIVFWTFGSAGHAAIYAGNGQVISTQGNGSSVLPVGRFPLGQWNTSGKPVGWVAPEMV